MYPNGPQGAAPAKAFGCARVVFNDALRARREVHGAGEPCPKVGELSKLLITEAKKTPGRSVVAVRPSSWRPWCCQYSARSPCA
ncbi:helix-turn-helix domain-containing protein [Streptomyces sp. NPDC001514]